MKKWLSVLTIIGMSASYALGSGLGGFGSYWDSEDADDTFGGGAVLRLDLDQSLKLDLRGSYFEFDDREGGIEATLEVIPVEAALLVKLPLDQNFNAYVGGGGGYYFADAEFKAPGGTADVDIDDEFGFFALGGVEIMLSDTLSIFGEAKYTWVEFEEAEFEDAEFEIDLDMTGFGANAGLLFKF